MERICKGIFESEILPINQSRSNELGNELSLYTLPNFNKKHILFNDAYKEFSECLNSDAHISFNYRIQDAIDNVKLGFGDRVVIRNYGPYDIVSVRKYFDRAYGKAVRQKFIEILDSYEYEIKYSVALIRRDRPTLRREKLNLTTDDKFETWLGYSFPLPSVLYFDTPKDAMKMIESLKIGAFNLLRELTDYGKQYKELFQPYIDPNIKPDDIYYELHHDPRSAHTDAEIDLYNAQHSDSILEYDLFVEQVILCKENPK